MDFVATGGQQIRHFVISAHLHCTSSEQNDTEHESFSISVYVLLKTCLCMHDGCLAYRCARPQKLMLHV